MFNARQVQILLLLWDQDHSGDYLAKQVNSSRRTIIRDINILNQELSDKGTATISSKGKYGLEIHNYSQFQSLINQFENQERNILYCLLKNNIMSQDELIDQTLLTRNEVINSVERINQQNKDTFIISSKAGQGYSLNLSFGSKVDLLAYLILVIPKKVNFEVNRDDFPDSLRSYITDGQLIAQLKAIKLTPEVSFKQFYDDKKKILESIQFKRILASIEKVSKNFSIKLSKQNLSEKITFHLRRYNLFPTFISNLLIKQMNDLRLKEPFAFEMAIELKKELEQDGLGILVNSDFLALYIIDCMETRTTVKPVKVLMFTSQRSIAYINENVITESIKQIDLTSIFNLSEFNQKVKTNNYDIVITNGFNDKLNCNPDIVINGLIDDATMSYLKKMVGDNYFHNNINQMFPKENFLPYANESTNYFKTLKGTLKHFNQMNLLDQEMAEKLIDREEEGNQLVINHVAIPHAVSEADLSRIFAVDLKQPVKLNGTEIYFILLVIVNDRNNDYKQLFNYLYKILSREKIEDIDSTKSYEQILDILKNT